MTQPLVELYGGCMAVLKVSWCGIRYESRDASIYHSMPLPRCIRDPESAAARLWDVVQVMRFTAF